MSTDRTDQDLSFGIELEFLLYWRRTPFDEQNAPASMVTRDEELAKPVLVDQDGDDDQNGQAKDDDSDNSDVMGDYDSDNSDVMGDYDSDSGKEMIRKLFRENGIHLLTDGDVVSPLFPDVYLDPTTGWVVKGDSSVIEGFHGQLAEWMTPGYSYCGIEINSPILRDCEAAHEHVRQVVRLLTDNCHIRVNPNCGLHCHVGAGIKLGPNPTWQNESEEAYLSVPYDLRTLKRAAMLFWAADPSLAALHPPERQHSYYSHMLRVDSRLAKAAGPEYKPTSPSVRVPHPPLLQTSTLDAGRERLPILRSYKPAPGTRFRYNLNGDRPIRDFDMDAVANQTIMDGVAKILHRARSRRRLAGMMGSTGHVRTNYNFVAYQDFVPNPGYQIRRTVEFREAAGSVDADWIVTWARICTGIFSFCRNSDEATFRRVLVRLAAAEQAALDGLEPEYDAVDLLRDLGLFAEAVFVEQRDANKLAAWYPGRIAFFPGESLRRELFELAHMKSRARPGGRLSQLVLSRDLEGLRLGHMVYGMWEALRHCPEYAAVTSWLLEALQQDGGFGPGVGDEGFTVPAVPGEGFTMPADPGVPEWW
ncbi:hypothetical protein B0T18DRAFT_464931 [Schizothecium vesticola]|uniref:Amidoligase enzyme n=1 Tax=Schizothecium vesticola TaxID=314040 RepID=A0AA40EV98_9PEZI|nr:hypothetical protein B0T18DRAFT_464931 [Schizothecium vesticola]